MHLTRTNTAAVVFLMTLGLVTAAVRADAFTEASSWATHDAGANGVGTDPDGYVGAVFDGRYVYFAPHHNGSGPHAEVLRYDTVGAFDSVSSWATFDAQANGVATEDGYRGGVFDGQYVYFAPYIFEDPHGEVLRYDTTQTFSVAASWAAYDPGADGVGTDPTGYNGAGFDGRYIYFVPYYNGSQMHGEVLRYDTQGQFDLPASWATYDVKTNDPPGAKGGYSEAVFDGRYVYFAPHEDWLDTYQGEVLRYDTQGDFGVAASWETFDAKANNPPGAKGGYTDAVFDGRYVYFAPDRSAPTSFHGEVLRYDTQAAFDTASSWAIYEAGAHGVGDEPTGYSGSVFDGQYVYFVPYRNPDYHGEVLRYDTTQAFTDALSWAAYDAGNNGVGTDPDGYAGAAIFDGQYVYFAPYYNGTEQHGEVLRFDTAAGIPAVSEWGLVVTALLMLTGGTLLYARRRRVPGVAD